MAAMPKPWAAPHAAANLTASFCLTMKNLRVVRRRRLGGRSRTKPPFLRGLSSFGAGQATWLGLKAASQLRDSAGFPPDFAAVTPAERYVARHAELT